MYLSKSGSTYALKCHCGHYNLSFGDHGIDLTGTVTCFICGAQAEWQDLLAAAGLPSAPEPGAAIRVLDP
jgi:hypothetical protein